MNDDTPKPTLAAEMFAIGASALRLPDPPSPFEADAREHLEWLFRNCDVSHKRTGEILHNVADLEAELTRERQRAAEEFRAEQERYYHHD